MGYVTLRQVYDTAVLAVGKTEARILCEHFLGSDYNKVIMTPDKEVSPKEFKRLKKALDKRKRGVPLQYILKSWEFYGIEFKVGKGVLIPRQDTETLCEQAIALAPKNGSVLDLCSGSGCIPIAIKANRDDLSVFAVEKHSRAFKYLKENIRANAVNITAVKDDVLKPIKNNTLPDFDVITANPPYLSKEDMKNLQKEVGFEPKTALYGGKLGLDFYKGMTLIWKHKLKSGGLLMYEIGAGMFDSVEKIMKENGFVNICAVKDLCGIIRVIYGAYGKECDYGTE